MSHPATLRPLAALLTLCAASSLPSLAAEKRERDTTPIHSGLHYYQPMREKTPPEKLPTDLCVYGGTSAGVIAAVQAARDGRKVVLVAPEGHLGGLTTGGLTNTDIGNKDAIGGLSREFYRRVGKAYGEPEEWRFEPKVAEAVYLEMVRENNVPVRYGHFLKSVKKDGARIVSLTTERGLTVTARMFIDATYEGDLMAKAGVRYAVGREANSVYNETVDGVQVRNLHQFEAAVSPYVVEDDPSSGLLPNVNPGPLPAQGTGDHRVQAYNFRMTLTTVPENRIPFVKPEGYDPRQYVLLARYLRTGWDQVFRKYDPIQGQKVDTNNHGAVSTDFIGMSYGWADADYRTREKIFQQHVVYQQGLMWFLANDPSVPEPIRTKAATWGLCKDEFGDTGGWPRQLYIREARRMVSDYVMTEHECRGARKVPDAVGLAAYTMDSHNCQRFVKDGRVWNEGDVQVGGFPPYPISYRSIVPRRKECENLLVPVCLSATHIAYGSIRMEPVFMILAQSATAAAEMAMDGSGAVQEVDVPKLQARLLQLGQVLEWTRPAQASRGDATQAALIAPGSLPGIVLDDADGKKTGDWVLSARAVDRKVGTGYIHDNNTNRGQCAVAFTPEIPEAGEYELFLIAPPNPNRATNVPVTIATDGDEPKTVRVNQREETGAGFHSLGRFRLPAGRKTTITISNRDADGYVVIDGIQLIKR